jgi:hypothetical protein
MPAERAYREVVPNDSVLFEEVLEALRESQLAAAVEAREAQARNQDCHVTTGLTASSELKCNATALRWERANATSVGKMYTQHGADAHFVTGES